MSIDKKLDKCLVPEKLRNLVGSVLRGDFARVYRSLKNPDIRYDWDNLDDAKKSILWYDDWEEATESTIELMQKMEVIKREGFVVDWGCGVGRIANKLTEDFDVTVLAVDRSIKMLRHALTYIKPQYLSKITITTDRFVLSHLDLFKKWADLVIFIETFEHIPEPVLDQILPQIEKLLKKNGKVFVYGNEQLDYGYRNRKASKVEEIIKRYFELEKSEVTFRSYKRKVANLVYGPRRKHFFVAKKTKTGM
jgi:cyclopropane fatty-acyl-phospholipid synthase-like methyltransferase